MKKYLASNYTLHAVEGSLYFAGLCFVAFETVLPQMIKSMGGSTWMITIAPVLVTVGCAIPSMFTAEFIDRLPLKKPIIAVTGFLQRIPFLIAGLLLLAAAWLPGSLVIWALLAAPLCSGLAAGVTLPAWFDLVARTVPVERMTSLYAIRYAFGALAGIVIGWLVNVILQHWPDHIGYGLLFICAAAMLFLSYYYFMKIREPAAPEANVSRHQPAEYREVISDRNIQLFLLCRFFSCGSFIGLSFIPIHVLKTLNLPQNWLGYFVIAVICGAISGNLFASFWSRHNNCRSGLFIAISGYIVTFTCCLFTFNGEMALASFFLLGFSRDCWNSFISTLTTALPPRRLRMKSIALVSTLYAPGLILACMVGAALWSMTESYVLVIVISLLSQCLCLAVIRKMPRI